MAAWGKWTAIVGAILAVVGYFAWASMPWLTIVGGLLSIVGGFGSE